VREPNSSATTSARERPSIRSPAVSVPAGECTDHPRAVRVREIGVAGHEPVVGVSGAVAMAAASLDVSGHCCPMVSAPRSRPSAG
jgi:hypothetical protein